MRAPHRPLAQICAHILEANGSAPEEARCVADHLVGANLAGHDSHGVGLMGMYVANMKDGLVNVNQPPHLTADRGSALQFDGRMGFGAVAGRRATVAGIERCRDLGLAMVTLGQSHHLGRIGAFAEMAAQAGLVSLHFVNVNGHEGIAAPFRGTDGRFGTNPMCVAFPATSAREMFVMDMATTKVALGKTRVAMERGEPLAPGLVLDGYGRPTTDSSAMFVQPRGALVTMGEHKGYALAFACELMAGLLSGLGTIQPENRRPGAICNQMASILIDPAGLADPAWLEHEYDAVTAYITASPPSDPAKPVLMPGDPERAARAERGREGVPLPDSVWSEICAMAADAGMERAEVEGVLAAG